MTISQHFWCAKNQKNLMNPCCLTFWFMNILFRAYFREKIPEETWPEFFLGQDPEPDPQLCFTVHYFQHIL
jgi:hypothetical protein